MATYEIRRGDDDDVYLDGAADCPSCGKNAEILATPPATPEDRYWTLKCQNCQKSRKALFVEKVEVTSL